MNLNVFSVVLLGVGGILVYSAVKNKDPRAVVREALGGPKAETRSPATTISETPAADETGDGPMFVPAVYPSV